MYHGHHAIVMASVVDSERWGKHRGEHECEQERREGQEHVGDPHDHVVPAPADVPRQHAEGDADRDRGQQDQERDHGRDARPVHHAREDVAPDLVGAEQMLRRRRLQEDRRVGRAPGVLGVRGDPRREDPDHDDRHRDHGAEQQEPVRPEGPGDQRARRLAGLDQGLDGAHDNSILGSRAACTMSTTRFPITYTIAMNSVTPTIAGVSSAATEVAA